jgi:hypothetical protein
MNYLKSIAMVFAALIFGGSIAQAGGIKVYEGKQPVKGRCKVQVLSDGAGDTILTTNYYSAVPFRLRPTVSNANELELIYPQPGPHDRAVNIDKQSLRVKYTISSRGEIIPVSYIWTNLTRQWVRECDELSLQQEY